MTADEDVPKERRNMLLRMLINEMLEQVREIQRQASAWPEDERKHAEESLERIMGQVRREAARRGEV